ncbi:MAG: sulfatase-like hydrolase/transferase [Candidatus Hodarchaeota archaeon]
MKAGSLNINESLYSGMYTGVIAWTAFAVVEWCFSFLLGGIILPRFLHWEFTALLFTIYVALGLILGALFGLGLHVLASRSWFMNKANSAIIYHAAATFTVVLVFFLNLVVNYSTDPLTTADSLDLSELPELIISLFLACGLGVSAGSNILFRRLRFLTNPWTISIILLGLPFINKELLVDLSITIKATLALTFPLVVSLMSYFVLKIVEKMKICTPILSASRIKSLGFLTALVIIVNGVSLFLDQEPNVVYPALRVSPLVANNPNVILITLDTVRADHMSLYGYERDTTPFLKKFSEEATQYVKANASADMTLPTHASIFTGLYARQHGAHYDPKTYPAGRPLDAKFHTLAEILSYSGYLTLSVVANYAYLGHAFGVEQGFQYYDQRVLTPFLEKTQNYYLRQGVYNILKRFVSPSRFDKVYRSAEEINREIFRLLKKVKGSGEPFLFFINYMDAHWPYLPPPPFDTLYPEKVENFSTDRYYALKEKMMKLEGDIKQVERDHLISQYDGAIAYLDFQLGKLIQHLKKIGLYENSLIIITSDHGEAFGERNLIEHAVGVYQDQVYIPLIIKYPNSRQKMIVDEIVSVIDIMPTVLDVLGYEIPENVSGQSLFRFKPCNERIIISESFANEHFFRWNPSFDRIERAIFSGTFKYINSTKGKRELYNLSKDPSEKNNLYKSDNVVAKELEMRLEQWLHTTVAEYGSSTKLDKASHDRLKSLGYIK